MKYPDAKPKHRKLKDEYDSPDDVDMPDEVDYIHREEPKEHVKGWWFPQSLIQLYEKGIISAEEMMLLGRVHVLCDPKKGCFASNAYLAKFGNRSKRQISRALAHLEELQLISISIKRLENQGTKRTIWTVFDIPLGGRTKRVGGGTLKGLSVVYTYNNIQRGGKKPPRGDKKDGSFNLGEGRVYQACKDFRHFIKGRTGKRYTDHILQRRWRTVAESFVQEQLKGDQGHFLKVLDWYKQNADGEYITECLSIPHFCEKFRQVEKARSRHLQNGTDPESPHVTVTTHKTSVVRGTKCKSEDTW